MEPCGSKPPVVSITAHFAELKHPRLDRTKAHALADILVIAICAIICGANDWEAVAEFGRSKQAWFQTLLELPNGIPSHDTFWRVFRALDPAQFQNCFLNWMRAVSPLLGGQVVAIDGKQLRRSHDKGLGQAAIYMVSAWATANRLVLGQRKVAEKSNEITAIPLLLQALDLRGCLVTIDAIGCQTAMAAAIIAQHADYLLALKANQGQLYDDVVLLFADLVASGYRAYAYDHASMCNKGHGRLERRAAWTSSEPKVLAGLRHAADFASLTTVMMVRLERRLGTDVSVEWRYYIASRNTSAAQLLRHKRSHWRIENSLHWVLDIAFREDESRLRKGHGAQNFAILRHIALNLLKQETTCKLGTFNKRLKAAWDTDYLLTVLATLFK
ncbi:MAG TPA: ISAs1 family transposase [Anaerolineae bacterium]|nr:ISAs1 family transposase [Anaerolineae bacterium]